MPPTSQGLTRSCGSHQSWRARSTTAASSSAFSTSSSSSSSALYLLSSSSKPNSNTGSQHRTDPLLAQARDQSKHRLRDAWDSIFDRYTRDDHLASGRDDVVDVLTGEIVEDAGFLAEDGDIEIGAFGLPGAMGQDDCSEGEEAVEEASDEGDDEQEGNGGSGDHDASTTRTRRKRNRAGEASEDSSEDSADDASTSEDELGAWSGAVGKPSERFYEAKRANEALQRDMAEFLELEAGLQKAVRKREESAAISHTRRLKSESVKPTLSRLATPSTMYHPPTSGIFPSLPTSHSAPNIGSRMRMTTPASFTSVKPEGVRASSICSARSASYLRRTGTSSSLQKTKPLFLLSTPPVSGSSSPSKPPSSASSSFSISATVVMKNGNAVLPQALAGDDDDSDDDISIQSMDQPQILPSPPKAIKKREDSESVEPQRYPAFAHFRERTSSSTKTPKMEPVVEILVPHRRPTFSSPRASQHAERACGRHIPQRSSPLKHSVSTSDLSQFYATPPLSQSPERQPTPLFGRAGPIGLRRASPITIVSDSEDDLAGDSGDDSRFEELRSFAVSRTSSSPRREPKKRPMPPSPSRSTPTLPSSRSAPAQLNISANHPSQSLQSNSSSFYFPHGPPSASTSSHASSPDSTATSSKKARKSVSSLVLNRIKVVGRSTNARKQARSPSPVYARGQEPWRLRKPSATPRPAPTPYLPTPPPSQGSQGSNARAASSSSTSPDRTTSALQHDTPRRRPLTTPDVFKSPRLPRSGSALPNRTLPHSPVVHLISSDSECDEDEWPWTTSTRQVLGKPTSSQVPGYTMARASAPREKAHDGASREASSRTESASSLSMSSSLPVPVTPTNLRAASVAVSQTRLRTPKFKPPDDDSEDSDDPLAI